MVFNDFFYFKNKGLILIQDGHRTFIGYKHEKMVWRRYCLQTSTWIFTQKQLSWYMYVYEMNINPSTHPGENIKALVLKCVIIRNRLIVDLHKTIAYPPAQTMNQSTNICWIHCKQNVRSPKLQQRRGCNYRPHGAFESETQNSLPRRGERLSATKGVSAEYQMMVLAKTATEVKGRKSPPGSRDQKAPNGV